jgi:hypothetical protein
MLALRVLRALRGQDPFLFTTECTEVTEEMGLRPRLCEPESANQKGCIAAERSGASKYTHG